MVKALSPQIDDVFKVAAQMGRRTLYEHEVYEILGLLGINTPRYLVVKEPGELSNKMLSGFGPNLVLKIISPEIAHKQKLGGVKIVENQPVLLQEAMERMQKEVLSHFTKAAPPQIEGFLLVEFVEYTPALGNETMLGCREDEEFGPIVLISKGGDDAEFFAKNYDRANIVLPPLGLKEAQAFIDSLKIAAKLKDKGKEKELKLIAQALARLSELAAHYSFISPEKSNYKLQSLDINPLVISADNRLVAIDGFAEFITEKEQEIKLTKVNTSNLEAFFRPQSIAVIGVSADLSRQNIAREIAKLLHKLGRKDIYLINPRGGTVEINGTVFPLYKSIKEINKKVDLVVYAAPAAATPQFLTELEDQAKAVIVISGLPGQMEYAEFAARLDESKAQDVRIIGPNCMGVFFAPDRKSLGVNTLFIEEKRLAFNYSKNSNTALLTQSGALGLTGLDRMKNSGIFKAVVSFGNQYDVTITDLTAYFAQAPDIDLISLYIEGLSPGEGRLFFELAQRVKKPILVYKSGRTEAGAQAAASHTAAMSGDYEVFKAACRQAQIVIAETLSDYYDYTLAFSCLAKHKVTGKRVAGVVNAGFEATVAADELQSLMPARLTEKTLDKLKESDRHGLVDLSSPFLDVTPMADDQIFTSYVEAVLKDENVDCVFVGIVPHSNALKSTPDTCNDPDSTANLLVKLSKKYAKPLVVSVNAGRYYDDFVAVMEKGGLPVYCNIRAAVRSLHAFIGHHCNT